MTKIKQEANGRTIKIDSLVLDLETCERCKGTDANLEAVLTTVQSVLTATGATVSVRKALVDTEQRALELGFVSSPTIRRTEGKPLRHLRGRLLLQWRNRLPCLGLAGARNTRRRLSP